MSELCLLDVGIGQDVICFLNAMPGLFQALLEFLVVQPLIFKVEVLGCTLSTSLSPFGVEVER